MMTRSKKLDLNTKYLLGSGVLLLALALLLAFGISWRQCRSDPGLFECLKKVGETVSYWSTFGLAFLTIPLAYFSYKLWSATAKTILDAGFTSRLELRAYAYASGMYFDGKGAMAVVFANSGRTVTEKANIKFFWGYFDRAPGFQELREELESQVPGLHHAYIDKLMLGPQAEMHSRKVTPEPLAAQGKLSPDATQSLYVWGEVLYRDIIEKSEEHRTRFCFQIFNDGIQKDNSYRYVMTGDFNDAT